MAEKRYFYLMVTEKFFSDRIIRKLQTKQNGDRLVILYLRLLLMSCEGAGSIYLDVLDGDTPAEQLAFDLMDDAEEIQHLLDYLEKNGLIEYRGDAEIYFQQFESLTGSVTDAAIRQRRSRAKRKDESVTMSQSCHDTVTEQSRYIEIDSEKEKKTDKQIEQHTDFPDTEKNHSVSDGQTDFWKEVTDFLLKSGLNIPELKIIHKKDDVSAGIMKLMSKGYSLEDIKSGLLKCFKDYKQGDAFSNNGWKYMQSIHTLLTERADILETAIKRIQERNKSQNQNKVEISDAIETEMSDFYRQIIYACDSLGDLKPSNKILLTDNSSNLKRMYLKMYELLESGYSKDDIVDYIIGYFRKYGKNAVSLFDLFIDGILARFLESHFFANCNMTDTEQVTIADASEDNDLPFG